MALSGWVLAARQASSRPVIPRATNATNATWTLIRFKRHLPPQTLKPMPGNASVMGDTLGVAVSCMVRKSVPGSAIGERLGQALAVGDLEAAKIVGLPLDKFLAHTPSAPLDPTALAYVRAAAQSQATMEAVNEAWAMVALLTLAGALAVCRPTGCDEDPREMSRNSHQA